ncbi:hypothetical protein KY285_020442 [Solanum tuberosum]|nr:hypothetical protein KY285_020442 [Solanum tuberosum]
MISSWSLELAAASPKTWILLVVVIVAPSELGSLWVVLGFLWSCSFLLQWGFCELSPEMQRKKGVLGEMGEGLVQLRASPERRILELLLLLEKGIIWLLL